MYCPACRGWLQKVCSFWWYGFGEGKVKCNKCSRFFNHGETIGSEWPGNTIIKKYDSVTGRLIGRIPDFESGNEGSSPSP